MNDLVIINVRDKTNERKKITMSPVVFYALEQIFGDPMQEVKDISKTLSCSDEKNLSRAIQEQAILRIIEKLSSKQAANEIAFKAKSHTEKKLAQSVTKASITKEKAIVEEPDIDIDFGIDLTKEQKQIIASTLSEKNSIVVEALAGTGKTTTLVAISKALHEKHKSRGIYIAFNKSIVQDISGKINANGAIASTMHALAYKHIAAKKYKNRVSRFGVSTIREALNINIKGSDVKIAEEVLKTLQTFLRTTDAQVTLDHYCGANEKLADTVIKMTRAILAKMRTDESFPITHDYYLREYVMKCLDGKIDFPYDYILFDEAQDADKVMLAFIEHQIENGKRVFFVGDENQQIYEWRGAVNSIKSMKKLMKTHYLTQSFRFGEAIAEDANKILYEIGSNINLKGFTKVESKVVFQESVSKDFSGAIIVRKNSEAIEQIAKHVGKNKKVAIRGKADFIATIKALKDAQDGIMHGDFKYFKNFQEIKEYAKEYDGSLNTVIKLYEEYGYGGLYDLLEKTIDHEKERQRFDIYISTAHKAKGQEFDNVFLSEELFKIKNEEDLRLLYVAKTRAKKLLINSRDKIEKQQEIDLLF